MIAHTGRIPTQTSNDKEKYESLEEVRKRAHGPVVVFPECTTSNGRGLLRFADVFKHEKNIPVKGYQILLMCIR
jgi:1-acyl-sn-glycerol-3-phosphate acyltransferase